MAVAPLKRPMFAPSDPRGPTVGKDVQIAKFGLGRYPNSPLPKPAAGYSRTFGEQMAIAVAHLQKREGLPVTRNIGHPTWAVIWKYLDAYRRWQYRNWTIPTTFEQQAWEKFLDVIQELSAHTPGYLLGGGHGVHLDRVSAYQRLDCSSSTSKALYEAGLFEGRSYAIVSGMYDEWGVAGTGEYFTVYYNYEHVWTRLHKATWWRFDTSPHGDGGGGPRLRYLPRFSGGFRSRHFPGL
jgi:hypothetical protein